VTREVFPIDWQHIAEAVSFYTKAGYRYLEVPWLVSREAILKTLPEDHVPISCVFGDLVGSAEQSFIQMTVVDEQKLDGKYVAVTPCFRDDRLDQEHQRAFMKVELIEIHRDIALSRGGKKGLWACSALEQMINDAKTFFGSIAGTSTLEVTPIAMDMGFDLELNGVEVGSYGVRTHGAWIWVYGTGYASPRFSVAKSYEGRNS